MQKFLCAIGFLAVILVFQDCSVPVESVRVRVVKVKRQDNHYTKRQTSRNAYTDVPLQGDPDAEAFPVNTNTLRPEENPYNANNRPADYPLNNNVGFQGSGQQGSNERYYPGSTSRETTYNNRQTAAAGASNRPSRQKEEIKGEDCPGCGHSIPGEAGTDYPNYNTPPKTAFSCSNQQWSGYYADTEARCQVFWICQKNRADAFLCPNGTIFNQQVFVCDWWFNSDCNTAPDYYSRNQYLYAGPTVDLFGNTITPYKDPNPQPQRIRSTAAPARLETAPVNPVQNQPQRQIQQVPQRPQQQQQQQQQQRQPIAPVNQGSVGASAGVSGGYGSPVSNRRNDDYPIASATAVPTVRATGGYVKRNQQAPVQKLDYRNERLKQTQNSFPVPGNSLAAVDGDFGLKMNNYKAAVEYVNSDSGRQQYEAQRFNDRAEEERKYGKGGFAGNQGGYSNPSTNRGGGYSSSKQGGYSSSTNSGYSGSGYSSSAAYAQTERPVARRVSNDEQQLPRQPLYSSTSYKPESGGFGKKLQQRTGLKAEYVADQQEAGSFSSEVPSAVQPYSSTTKRNAIDYDSENTTPLSLSHDDDLVATLSTPRYGEIVPKSSSAYSTEVEVPSIETTTAAPLSFGQKLTRAARKRNSSSWGNWRTMLLGNY